MSTLPHRCSVKIRTHTRGGGRCATRGHLGDGGRLSIGVKVCRDAEDLRGNSLGEAGRGWRGLGTGAVVGGRLGQRPWGGALLGDGGQAGEARDAVSALGLEAVLRGVLVMAAAVACGRKGVAAVAVLDGCGGEGGERGCR